MLSIEAGIDPGVVAVDVASVCRDPALSGSVTVRRLDLVLAAWDSQIASGAALYLVSDSSLRKELSKSDRLRMAELRRERLLRYSRKGADELLLDHAEEHGGCVLSRDRFLDHRRTRVWRPERFYTWHVEAGEVRIIRQPSRNTQSFDISRKEEQQLTRARGISLDHPAARQRWTCASEVPCVTREASPEELRTVPLLEEGRPLCPGCRQPLRYLGPRHSEAELKLLVDGKPVVRFTLRQGETVTFGRLRLPDTVRLAELARDGAFSDLGREHVHLQMSGKRVAARPVDERHEVRAYAWNSRRRQFGRGKVIRHEDGFTPTGIRDILGIGKRLELVRSGRSIAQAEALPAAEGKTGWHGVRTVDLS
jgi:hypothetical protein